MGVLRSVPGILGGARVPGSTFATIGDSQLFLGIQAQPSVLKAFNMYGPMTYARQLSGQKVNYPLANQLAVGGTGMQAIAATAPAAAAIADFVVMDGGVNDWDGGKTAAQVAAFAQTGINSILAAGKIPIVIPLVPRTYIIDGTWLPFCTAYNALLQGMGIPHATFLAMGSKPRNQAIILDTSSLFAGDGSPIASNVLVSDGLHYGFLSAYVVGSQIAAIANAFNLAGVTKPSGIDLTTLGAMAGSAGLKTSSTGFTPSGNLATGWGIRRFTATSTMTAVCSKLVSDTVQRVQIASSTLGNATEQVQVYVVTNLLPAAGFAAGDVVQCGGHIAIDGCTGLINAYLNMAENGTAANQTAGDMNSATSTTTVPYSGYWRSPPITLGANITSISFQLNINMKTDVSLVDVDISMDDMWVRKIG